MVLDAMWTCMRAHGARSLIDVLNKRVTPLLPEASTRMLLEQQARPSCCRAQPTVNSASTLCQRLVGALPSCPALLALGACCSATSATWRGCGGSTGPSWTAAGRRPQQSTAPGAAARRGPAAGAAAAAGGSRWVEGHTIRKPQDAKGWGGRGQGGFAGVAGLCDG